MCIRDSYCCLAVWRICKSYPCTESDLHFLGSYILFTHSLTVNFYWFLNTLIFNEFPKTKMYFEIQSVAHILGRNLLILTSLDTS